MKVFKFTTVFLFLLISLQSRASHIRAGEIIAKRVDESSLTYQFTFIGYRDVDGVLFGAGIFDYGDGRIFQIDPNDPDQLWEISILGNGVEEWKFVFPVHTYQAASDYLVSYTEDYRNNDILNMLGSGGTAFHVETLVVMDQLIGSNSTPAFLNPPIDQAVVGYRFEHDPAAFDPDGDSLAFYFTVPKKANDQDVDGYRSLIDPSFYDDFNTGSQDGNQPTLTIDPVLGILEWDAPGSIGIPPLDNREYNVAFVVEEYRKINGEYVKLGYVTRDMQIIVWNFDNQPPELEVPEDTCVVAGDVVAGVAIGTDPEGDAVMLEAAGGPFEVNSSATVSPDPPEFQRPPAVLSFEWQTVCGHVRERPYEVVFKATDDPSIPEIPNAPGSVNFETWRIQVVGPAPTGLSAETQMEKREIALSWDPYSCSNAVAMQVWRRVDQFEIEPGCDPGMPANSGYELIETLDISETSLLDDNGGLGLAAGAKYCYRLVATFPSPAGGLSLVSEEACDSLAVDAPVITNVDTRVTDIEEGELLVAWTPSYEIGGPLPIGSYTYTVLRVPGINQGADFTEISTAQSDTFFIDNGLNTRDEFYSYRILVNDDQGVPLDSSSVASSLRIEPTSLIGAIQLDWSGNTPWSLIIQDFPNHYIFRDHVLDSAPDSVVLIDSVNVTETSFTYLDDGRFSGVALDETIEYCYYVLTQGSYGNALLPEPLLNRTQIACVYPSDSIPPCTPINIAFDSSPEFSCEEVITSQSCDFREYQNRLIWTTDDASSCDDDVRSYRIYFSDTGQEETFVLLEETINTSFVHEGLNSFAGCYQVAAVDLSGNESERSEVFCNDNCPTILFPNVFTPNGDGLNDVFRPFYSGGLLPEEIEGFSNSDCPRFVRSLTFRVFNRAGVPIFEYSSIENENDLLINWDGTTLGGKELPSGTYYYASEVAFERLNPEDTKEVYNGWVQLLR